MARPGRHLSLAAALALVAFGCGDRARDEAPAQQDPAPVPPGPNPQPKPGIEFGTRGPWSIDNVVYAAGDGILESPVVGVTTDEAQNRWVATHEALYLLRPGDEKLQRYDADDGLHLPGNPVRYCFDRAIGPGDPCPADQLSTGAAAPPGISVIVGGAPGEVFVGYHGIDETPGVKCLPKDPTKPPTEGYGDYCDPNRHSGKMDRVRLQPDGSLQVERFDFVSGQHGGEYWHNRTVHALAYDHFAHPHTLYAGTNHGVNIFFPDRFRHPRSDEWFDLANIEWMGDHLHARVCFHTVCPPGEGDQRMGGWYGIAIDANGDLWHAGRWTAGLITWDPDPLQWFQRHGHAFKAAFGDPYPISPNDEGFTNEPVFKVNVEGDSVYLTGVAVCPDGRVWFSSRGPENGTDHTVAAWKGRSFDTFAATSLGLAETAVADIDCLPDGRVVLAGARSGVVLYDPVARTSKAIRAGHGIPSDRVIAVEVDRMVSPPSLHVATSGGAAVLRVLP